MTDAELGKLSILALAHVGDAVYELLVRTLLAEKAAAVILPHLTEAEHDVYRRGRNSHVNTVPHGSTPGQYHAATAVEAVFGWLWLRGEHERARELFGYITEDYDAA